MVDHISLVGDDVILPAGLEFLETGRSITPSPVTVEESAPGFIAVRWAGVAQAIKASLQAHAYPL